MVPPELYQFHHLYWLDKNLDSLLISGDANPGVLHYYDLYFDIHIKKNIGHDTNGLIPHHFFKCVLRGNFAAFSPTSPFLLCTVSDDYLIKFWDFRHHFR